jgi:bleomycin hydrolase
LRPLDRPVDDRTIHFLLSDPIGDGGQWNMAMNLIRKHGLVPKSAYPESNSSSSTRWMNSILKDMLRSSASEIREDYRFRRWIPRKKLDRPRRAE